MSETLRYGLTLLDAAQAQKHVTINEALMRVDALASALVERRDLSSPPASPVDGACYIVGPSANGIWAGQEGDLAIFLNGGWEFVAPWPGQAAWDIQDQARVTWDGAGWREGYVGGSAGGAATQSLVAEIDHTLSSGTFSTTPIVIPDKAVVLGVTGRVTAAVTGATGWSLGVPGSPDRYGSGYGPDLGAFAHGVTGQPQAYYGGESLLITAEGGSFTGGQIRLAVHYLGLMPPA